MKAIEVMKKYRTEIYGLTQEEMAKELSMSTSSYKKIEQGVTNLKNNVVLDFINVLQKHKIKDKTRYNPISIFDFFYQIDNINLPKSFIQKELALNNASCYPKYIDTRLFEDICDNNQPMYQILYSFSGFADFISDFEKLMQDYKNLQVYKTQIDNNNGKNLNKEQYKKEITEPMQLKLNSIQKRFNMFLNDFVKYYCIKK